MIDLKEINSDLALELPEDVLTLFNEQKSNWTYTARIKNTTSSVKRIIFFTAGIPTLRISNGQILYDDAKLINIWTGVSAQCVATTTQDGRTQIIYSDDSGNIIYENVTQYGGIDFLRVFVLAIPVRIFQLQISSNNIDQFSQKIIIKRVRPFVAPVSQEIAIEEWFQPQQNQNKVIINRPIIVGADTVLTFDIPGETETSLVLKFSAELNQRKKLSILSDLNHILEKLKK